MDVRPLLVTEDVAEDARSTFDKLEYDFVEAEAFRIAHLAATLSAGSLARGNGGCAVKHIVDMAREILAESHRQAAAPAGERGDG